MKPRIFVLMFGHRARTGKDESCKYLQESLEFSRYAFADKLKDTVADLYGFSHEQMHGDQKDVEDKRYPNLIDAKEIYVPHIDKYNCFCNILSPNPEYKEFLTPRRVLQLFGQQQRSLYPDIWAAYVARKIDQGAAEEMGCLGGVHPKVLRFCISDFRFRNEYDVLYDWMLDDSRYEKCLYTIKLERPGISGVTATGDISENDLNGFEHWDFIVNNDGNIQELQKKIGDIWQKVRRQ